jgi:hypothetical protein
MAIDELVQVGVAALNSNDEHVLHRTLKEIREENRKIVTAENALSSLGKHEPESYQELIEKLVLVTGALAPSGRSELLELARAFEWCRTHGIGLDGLEVSENLSKYREAAAYFRRIRESKKPEQEKAEWMRMTLECIKSDLDREATRAWARKPKKNAAKRQEKKARGRQFAAEDGSPGLVIVGPRETVQRILSRIERSVDWDLPIDDATLDKLQHAEE